MRARWVAAVVLLVGLVGLGGALVLLDAPAGERPAEAVTADRGAQRVAGAASAGGPADDGAGARRRVFDVVAELRARMARPAPAPSPAQARAAAGALALFNDFDLEAAAEVFERPSVATEEWVEWLRARLGRCEAGELMSVGDDRARHIHPCERGRLEVEVRLGADGKISMMMMGARDIELAEPVRAAAEAVMQLYAAWDPALFTRTFGDKFVAEDMRRFLLDVRAKYGACTLAEPDLVSVRGVLINLDCERGDRLMKVELGQDDDRIKTLWIRDPRPAATP